MNDTPAKPDATPDAPPEAHGPATATSPPIPAPDPARRASRPRPPASGRIGGFLALLLLAILIGGGFAAWHYGWPYWQNLQAERQQQTATLAALRGELDALSTQLESMHARQSDLSRQGERQSSELNALQSRIGDSLELVSRISEELSGGRTRFELSAVEQLLLLANDRLLLHRDARSALAALDAADTRLAALADPQLFQVREALARERAALRAVPQPDLASAALSLSSLIDGAARLPLAAHSPTEFTAPETRARASGTADQLPGWQRALQAVQAAARSLFTVRRDEDAERLRLLPPEAEAVVVHVLILKLEGARAALLAGRTVPMREALASAAAWLDAEFRAGDPGVAAMQVELRRLQQIELAPPLPDISSSLSALRARLDRTTPANGAAQP